jgi:hypothetical protein
MIYSFYSRKLKHDVEFSIPGSSYIYVDLNGKPGTLGNQICHGGGLTGSTMSYSGDNQKKFEEICKNWWRKYISTYNDYDNL